MRLFILDRRDLGPDSSVAERFLGKKEVEGPIPSLGSIIYNLINESAEIAQLARAPAL